jgi:hypothetical protein
MKTILFTISLCSALLFSTGAVFATPSPSGYSEGWDVSGDLAGWGANTIVSNVAVVDIGGNPNGYLNTFGIGSDTFDIGALSQLPDVTGDYSGNIWEVSVDLSFAGGNFDDAWLRFRYLDATQNGWLYDLTDSFSNVWTTYSVTFDPAWSDAEALAAGWLTDQDVFPGSDPSVSWSQTMSNVFTTEVRISGEETLAAGIDNFRLAAVPEPATIFLLGSGLIGLAALRRKLIS